MDVCDDNPEIFLFQTLSHLSPSYLIPILSLSLTSSIIIYIVMVFIFKMPHMILGPQDYIFYNGNTSHFSLYIILFGPNYFSFV